MRAAVGRASDDAAAIVGGACNRACANRRYVEVLSACASALMEHGGNVTTADVFSRSRRAAHVRVRFALISKLRAADPRFWSLPRLGALMDRDHTTILYALERQAMRDEECGA